MSIGEKVKTRRTVFLPRGKYGRSRTKLFLTLLLYDRPLSAIELVKASGLTIGYLSHRLPQLSNMRYLEESPRREKKGYVSIYALAEKGRKSLDAINANFPGYITELVKEMPKVKREEV
jgi:DNA-binding MarR family transcriptional regulator